MTTWMMNTGTWAAVAAATRDAQLLVGTTVIPRPAKQVFDSLL